MQPEKNFSDWIKIKEKIHNTARIPRIREGEVWWCGMGENVGTEINGKNATFSRPVVIIKKMSRLGFMGVPLTSQEKTGSWYVEFEFLNKKEYAALNQTRYFSVHRLYSRMGQMPNSDLEKIRKGFLQLFT